MKGLGTFHRCHQNETIIVCGCGASLNDLAQPERFITIGVNDVGRRFQPDYLVVVNPKRQFSGDRFRYVENSRAKYLFTQLDLGVNHPNVVKFQLGKSGGTDFSNPNVLHYTNNSPYIALCLAIHLGAKRIGLIGVDFTDNHFFAKTGRHPLAPQFEKINLQYETLAKAANAFGVEIFNLSRISRLTAFPKMSPEEFAAQTIEKFDTNGATPALVSSNNAEISEAAEVRTCPDIRTLARPKVFVVNYNFLACGDVFGIGLRNAAEQLGITYADALWDDSALPSKIERFQPDLIFVVHGRRFVQKWGGKFSRYQTAVWLVDEPYEVDDTARWSVNFGTVFINDPNTISKHRNAHYLPICFDAREHFDKDLPRIYKAGFIGGYNKTRERFLDETARSGLLSYVVGGPWKSQKLRRLSLGNKVPPRRTTELYRQTLVVVNVFRDIHNFNREKIAARSMNPRIYEALACGALVLSEKRPEVSEVFPELPTFDDSRSMNQTLERLISDESYRTHLLEKSRARLAGHSYKDRLAEVIKICLKTNVEPKIAMEIKEMNERNVVAETATPNVEFGEAVIQNIDEPTVDLPEVQNVLSDSAGNGKLRESSGVVPTESKNGKLPRPGAELYPFTEMPRRNLIYHIYPVRGSMWTWNLEQMKRRVELFNGKRILGIVYDDRSESPERVQEYLDGHGFEFIIEKNDACGEPVTFPHMMEKIASDNPNEITFYAHAKGVKYEPRVPPLVRRWAEVQYRVALDNWLMVRDHLQRFAMTGPFKRHGRFSAHRHLADWHYSGSYFWMRNAHIFSRNYKNVPQFYGGVETFPGIVFRKEETTCLFMDNIKQSPYLHKFWSTANSILRRWESGVRGVPPPPDLVTPLPYKGYVEPRIEQKPDEFDWWVKRLLEARVSRLLTIGSKEGGVEWHLAREFFEQGRKIEITAIEKYPGAKLLQNFQEAENRFGQKLKLVSADSSSASIKEHLSDQYDAAFIDGDHGYRVCMSDFLLAKSLKAKLIGFHDVVDSDWHANAHCCVSRVWEELSQQYRTESNASGDWGGIGVVIL